LRRVATLVASAARSAEVFSAVAQEVAQVMHMPMVGVYRYDSDGLMTVIATVSNPSARVPAGHAGRSTASRWSRRYTGPAARFGWRTTPTFPARSPPELVHPDSTQLPELRSSSTALSGEHGDVVAGPPLPDHAEDRLAEFTELVATAIANSQPTRAHTARGGAGGTAAGRDAGGARRAPGEVVPRRGKTEIGQLFPAANAAALSAATRRTTS